MELPGSGFCTVTAKFPDEEALPVAVSFVAERKLVVIALLPTRTLAPLTKLEPVIVSV